MEAITEPVEHALGARITGSTPLPVGFGLQGYHITLDDGRQLALKAGTAPLPGQLEIEGYMLRELKRLSGLPVPEVYYSDANMLAMEWIDNTGGALRNSHQRHMAELLAELHHIPRPFFGFERDTVIGVLPQPNPQSKSWVSFYRDQRLLFLARFAHEKGKLGSRLLSRLEALGGNLDNYLDEPGHASLIHGDIWSGNVLTGETRINALIDPAIYFAHPEIELAFMTMFGSFGQEFFDAYGALADFDAKGFFKVRRKIYLLYPQLTHVLLCGQSYLRGIETTLKRLGY